VPLTIAPCECGDLRRPLPPRSTNVIGPTETAWYCTCAQLELACELHRSNPARRRGREGFPVRRAFAGVDLRALDPFVHMDQMGEVDDAPGDLTCGLDAATAPRQGVGEGEL
jgi:hypothetical protein